MRNIEKCNKMQAVGFRSAVLAAAVVAIAGCESTTYEIASTPLSRSICLGTDKTVQQIADAAQDYCAKRGKNAALDNVERGGCRHGTMTTFGSVYTFKCE